MRTEKSIVLDHKRTVKRMVVDVIMKDPKSGLASPTHAADLPGGSFLAVLKPMFASASHILILHRFAVCRFL